MDKLQKQFELMKMITPDRAFVAETKRRILAVKPRLSVFVFFRTKPMWARTLSVGVASVLLLLGVSFFIPSTPQLSSLQNTDALAKEANTLPSGIELQAVNYQNNKNEVIKTAFAEINDTNTTRHLKEGVIESEMNAIQKTNEKNKEIDQLLESVTL
jgi:hypothetical protein